MSLTLVRDNNIEVIMSHGQTNWPFVINVSNSIIGVTVLAMPFCFKTCGILLGCLMLLFSTWLTVKSCQLLMKAGVTSRRRSYSLLAYYTHGATGKLVVELGMIGLQLGTLVAQVVIIGDLGPAIVSKFTGIPNTERLRTGLIVFLCLFVGLPLGLLKDVRNLSKTSAMCIVFYGFFTVYVVLLSVPKLLSGDWYTKVYFWRQEGFFQCLPIFSFAFGCQTQLFIVYDALSEPSLKRINSIVGSAVHMCTAAYLLVGFFGYIAFSDVTDLSGDIINHFGENTMSDTIKLCFVFSIAVSIPLIVFPCRASLYTLLFPQKPQSDMPGSWKIPEFHFKVITTFIVVGSMIIGILVPNIEFVLGLNGATMGTLICYVFPALFFLAVMSDTSEGKGTGRLVLILGMTIMIVSTYTTLSTVKVEEPQALIKSEPMDKDLEKLPIKDDPTLDVDKKEVKETESNKDAEVRKPPDKVEDKDDDERQEPPNPQPPDDQEAKQEPNSEDKVIELNIDKKEGAKDEINVKAAKDDGKEDTAKPKDTMEVKEEDKDDKNKEVEKEVEKEKEADKEKEGEEEKRKAELEEKARLEEEKKWKEKDKKQEEILEKLEQQKEEQQKILEEQKHILEELKQHQEVHKDDDVKLPNADKNDNVQVLAQQQQNIVQPAANAQAAQLGGQAVGGQPVLAQQPVQQQVNLGQAGNQQMVGQQINMGQAGNQQQLIQQPVQQQHFALNQEPIQGQGLGMNNVGGGYVQQGNQQFNKLGVNQQGVAGQQAMLPMQANQQQALANNVVNVNQPGLVGQQQGVNVQQGLQQGGEQGLQQGGQPVFMQGVQRQGLPNQQIGNNMANNVINQVMDNQPLGDKPVLAEQVIDNAIKPVVKADDNIKKLKDDPSFRMKRDIDPGNMVVLDNKDGDIKDTEGVNRDLKQVNVQDNDAFIKDMIKPIDNEISDLNNKMLKDIDFKNVVANDVLNDARRR